MKKTMNSKCFSTLSVLLFSFLLSSNAFASDNERDVILEITDRYKEVKLGLTETSIYMIIDERTRSFVNLELQNQYKKDLSDFNDSEGNFIPGEYSHLSSNIIEISFSDIKNLDFSNGILRINYSRKIPFHLEDVLSINGNKALDNFYIEDLEMFYQAATSRN
jgi:hypothetical protein